MPAARVGDRSTCDGKISAGSPNVFIGGAPVQTDDIEPEVPDWLHRAVLGLGVASAMALGAGPVLIILGLAGGEGSGKLGHWAGGKAFGEGSDGQKITAFTCTLLGGLVGGKGGHWFDGYANLTKGARRDYLNKKYGRSGDLHKDINYRANEKFTYEFFKSKGCTKEEVEQYIRGVNLNKQVYIEIINSRKILWQYQAPGAPQGNWYSLSLSVKPTELGIYWKGTNRAKKTNEPKALSLYQSKHKVEMLRSTAARAVDDWSIKGQKHRTKGGALQLFSDDKNAFQYVSPRGEP